MGKTQKVMEQVTSDYSKANLKEEHLCTNDPK
jgi:hypothetical protein